MTQEHAKEQETQQTDIQPKLEPVMESAENEEEPHPSQIIEKMQAELTEAKDQYLRTVAEMENLRKRAERDTQESRKYAVSEFARDMINVCENLYRALDSMPKEALEDEKSSTLKTLFVGVDMTRNELLRAFEKHGLVRIMPKRGDAFDHNLHQAVSQIEDGGVPDGTIAQVIQAGYRMHDRLLQPSMVAVAKGTSDPKPTVDTKA